MARRGKLVRGCAAATAVLALSFASPAAALTVGGTQSAAPPLDLEFTVVSTSPVYVGADGTSTAFALLRNDDPATTLSISRDFTVTFYDTYGAAVGTVTGAEASGSGGSLSAGLRAVPPGQLGDVSASLAGVHAVAAVVTDASASASPYADPRLPLTAAPARAVADPNSDSISVGALNTSSYPDRLHVVVAAEDASGDLLGLLTPDATDAVPSGGTEPLRVTYSRLPGEPVADHYTVLVEGQADGVAASSLTTPMADDTPTSGTPATLRTRLLDGNHAPLAGETVLLIGRVPGKLPVVLASAKTDDTGRVALRSVLPATGELEVVFRGDAEHAPIGTGDFAFRVHPRQTFTAPKTARRGAPVTLKGTLPDYPGEKVTVQELVHGHWRGVRTLKADSHGSYKVVLHPSRGRHSYRSAVDGSLLHLAGTSSPVTVTIR